MDIYQVGGSVRDEILGVVPKDKDWVVVGSSPKEMEDLGFKAIGKDFPVFLHPETNEEYALARTERKSGQGYKGFTFYYDKTVTIEEDLERRDLTINAIAKDKNGKLIDPFNGMEDLKNKLFNNVSNAFSEDPLRAMRVGRFLTYNQLQEFKLTQSLKQSINAIVKSNELKVLSSNRVWAEIVKSLNNHHSANFFIFIKEMSLTDPWFRDLKSISNLEAKTMELKWVLLESQNQFKISNHFKLPKNLLNLLKVCKLLIQVSQTSDENTLAKQIGLLNIERNKLYIDDILTIGIQRMHTQKIKTILKEYKKLNLRDLDEIKPSEIKNEKHNRLLKIVKKINV